jgi:hypothetical protein
MTRTGRLIVDALASGATTYRTIDAYVARRKRLIMASGTIYAELIRLERRGIVESAFVEGPYPRTRTYWLSERVARDADMPNEPTEEDVFAIIVGFILALLVAFGWFLWRR